VLGCNKDNLSFALNNGVRKKNTIIFPTSVHMQKCHFVDPSLRTSWQKVFERFGITIGQTYLMHFGRVISLKHPDDALRAMKIAIEKDS
jgi:hypothetical protein